MSSFGFKNGCLGIYRSDFSPEVVIGPLKVCMWKALVAGEHEVRVDKVVGLVGIGLRFPSKVQDYALLLEHLNLLVEGLKVAKLKLVDALVEDPELSHSCTIERLHEGLEVKDRVANDLFEGDHAQVREFFEHIPCYGVALLRTVEQHC